MTTTTFDTWLRELAASGKLVKRGLKIARGLPLRWEFALSGNWTGATIASALRAQPDAGAVVKALTAANLGYDAGTDVTIILLSLTGAETAALPSDPTGEAITRLAWDVILTPSGGSAMRLMGGMATIAGEVTDV